MRRLIVILVAALVALAPAVPAGAAKPPRTGPPVTGMTLNLYVGGDIFRVLEPVPDCAGVPTPPGPELCGVIVQGGAVLAEIRATDFAERATALARLIRRNRPDVVGLQEVSLVTTIPTDPFGTPVGPPVTTDYLDLLLTALNARGPAYEVAATVDNATTPFLPTGSFVPGVGPVIEDLASLSDRDVILVRSDVPYDPPSAFGTAYTSAQLVVDVGGVPVEFTRGWTTVDVTVKGTEIKVVNTHLEPQYTDPAFIPANAIQAAQAAELMAILGGEAGPVLLLGDFNSAPGVDNGLPLPTPYEIITGAGFIDAWTLRRGPARPGFTCCQDSGLMNRRSALDQRIDIVWFRSGAGEPHLAWARTAGDRHADKTPSGLWPSDHAGTAARLLLP